MCVSLASHCAKNVSSTISASGRAKRSCKRHRRSGVMEGSVTSRGVNQRDPKLIFSDAGLSAKAAAGLSKAPRLIGNYKRDIASAGKYWRDAAALLAKLPKRRKRNEAEQTAAEFILSNGR